MPDADAMLLELLQKKKIGKSTSPLEAMAAQLSERQTAPQAPATSSGGSYIPGARFDVANAPQPQGDANDAISDFLAKYRKPITSAMLGPGGASINYIFDKLSGMDPKAVMAGAQQFGRDVLTPEGGPAEEAGIPRIPSPLPEGLSINPSGAPDSALANAGRVAGDAPSAPPPAANAGPSAFDGSDAEGALVPEFERKSPGIGNAAAPFVQQQRSAMDELVSIYQRLSDEQRSQATQLVNEIEAQKPSVFSPQNLLFLIAFGPQFLAQHWQRENQEWTRRMDMAKQRLMQIASGTQTGMAREMGQFARQQERAGQRRPPLVSDPQFRRYFAAKYGKDPATAGPGDTVVIPEQRLVADGREVVVPARQVSVEEAMMDEMQDRRTILR